MLADSLYLENINEYVQDQDKIVTYKWLSRKLDVPVNAAKQMLYSYVSHCRTNKSGSEVHVNVMYVVSGLVGDKEHQVHLIPEDELEVTKQHLKRILGVHVYSVQKSQVKEADSLYNANHDVTQEYLETYSKWSPMECPVLPPVAHTPREKKKQTSKPSSQDTHQPNEQSRITSTASETAKKPLSKKESVETKHEKQKHSEKAGSKKKKAKGTVTSMFAKQTQNEKEPVNTKVKQEPRLSPKKETKTTVVQLISPKKSASPKKGRSSSTKSTKLSTPVDHTKAFKGLGDSDIEDDESEEESQSLGAKTLNKPQKKGNNTKKRAAKSVTTEKALSRVAEVEHESLNKKRKRKRVQDLSSDEEETPVVKKPSKTTDSSAGDTNHNVGRRKKRVKRRIRKMYKNEDGEMVTEMVYESASTDASDEDEKQQDNGSLETAAAKEEKPKEIIKTGTKQSSLMSFFKK